jgi:hypothetical protein
MGFTAGSDEYSTIFGPGNEVQLVITAQIVKEAVNLRATCEQVIMPEDNSAGWFQ